MKSDSWLYGQIQAQASSVEPDIFLLGEEGLVGNEEWMRQQDRCVPATSVQRLLGVALVG